MFKNGHGARSWVLIYDGDTKSDSLSNDTNLLVRNTRFQEKQGGFTLELYNQIISYRNENMLQLCNTKACSNPYRMLV